MGFQEGDIARGQSGGAEVDCHVNAGKAEIS